MSAVGDARKRQTEAPCAHTFPDGTRCTIDAASHHMVAGLAEHHARSAAEPERADILAELAEVYAALNASTADITRLAAELHTAHGQIDRVRRTADEMAELGQCVSTRFAVREILAALDGGNS